MKLPVLITFLLIASPLFGQYVPTPDHAMAMALNEDSVQWKMQRMDGNRSGIIAEFTPEGESIRSWKQMVAQQITFSKQTLPEHIEAWKSMVMKGDSDVQIEMEDEDESSVTLSYRSVAFNEYSIRRFIKGNDGVYVLAYHVRLNEIDHDRLDLWRSIISKSRLVWNPQKP